MTGEMRVKYPPPATMQRHQEASLEEELSAIEARLELLDSRLSQKVNGGAAALAVSDSPRPSGVASSSNGAQRSPDLAGSGGESAAASAPAAVEKPPPPLSSLLLELEEACRRRERFQHMSSCSASLRQQVESAHDIAEKVSGAVRRLDTLQAAALATMNLTSEVIDLRNCAEGIQLCIGNGDLVTGASWVRGYRLLNLDGLQGLPEIEAIKASIGALALMVMEEFETSAAEADLERMEKCLPLLDPLELSERARDRYLDYIRSLLDEVLVQAVGSGAGSPVGHQLSSLYNATAAFIQKHLPLAVQGLSSCGGDLLLVKESTKHCMAAAADVFSGYMETSDIKRMAGTIASLVDASEKEFGGAFDLFAKASTLLNRADASLDELAILLQHTEVFERFVRQALEEAVAVHESTSRQRAGGGGGPETEAKMEAERAAAFEIERVTMDELVGEASGIYGALELQLMKAGVGKALAIDEVASSSVGIAPSDEGGAEVSSCVEDAFFVLQRAAHRALATGHTGTASSVLNNTSNVLTEQLLTTLNAFVAASVSRLPVGGAGSLDLVVKQLGQIDFSDLSSLRDQVQDNLQGVSLATDLGLGSNISLPHPSRARGGSDSSNKCLIYINNIDACEEYTNRLKDDLSLEVVQMFQPGHGTDLLLACLAEISHVVDAFRESRTLRLEEVLARLRPVLRGIVSSALGQPDKPGGVSYALSESQFALNGANDPWAHQFVRSLGLFFSPYGPQGKGLSEKSYRLLLLLAASYVAERLEMSLRKRRFTQLGGLQLDKDLRSVMGFFTEQGGFELRAPFARLQQMAALLNLDVLAEACDYWNVRGGALRRHLSAEEVRSVLRLRQDFDAQSLQQLELG